MTPCLRGAYMVGMGSMWRSELVDLVMGRTVCIF